eukprot:352026-Chlamydomonas_euryale.AAC.3
MHLGCLHHVGRKLHLAVLHESLHLGLRRRRVTFSFSQGGALGCFCTGHTSSHMCCHRSLACALLHTKRPCYAVKAAQPLLSTWLWWAACAPRNQGLFKCVQPGAVETGRGMGGNKSHVRMTVSMNEQGRKQIVGWRDLLGQGARRGGEHCQCCARNNNSLILST